MQFPTKHNANIQRLVQIASKYNINKWHGRQICVCAQVVRCWLVTVRRQKQASGEFRRSIMGLASLTGLKKGAALAGSELRDPV